MNLRYRTAAGLLALVVGLTAGCGEGARIKLAEVALPIGAGESADPSLARDPDTGDALLTWIGGDSTGWTLYFSRSGDQGATWSPPVMVASGPHELHPHGEGSPRLVAARGGRLAATWANSIPVEGRQWPAAMMRMARSTDGGRTWSAPITLNDDTTGTPVSHQFHGAAWEGDSSLVVAWLDERKGPALAIHHGQHDPNAGDVTSEPDAMIVMARSPDFGATWGPNIPLWGQVCPCCRVTLARDPEGRVVSAWRKHYPGNIRDVVTAVVDSGAQPERVNEDGWVYPGCPHTGPAIAVDDQGTRHVAWYMGREGRAGIYYRRLAPGTQAEDTPVALVRSATLPTSHTTLAALPGGRALVAYDVDAGGDRRIGLALMNGADAPVLQPVEHSGGGTYPQVVQAGPGAALVAWTAPEGDRLQVHMVRATFDAAPVSLSIKEQE